jgi:hypothetical protein
MQTEIEDAQRNPALLLHSAQRKAAVNAPIERMRTLHGASANLVLLQQCADVVGTGSGQRIRAGELVRLESQLQLLPLHGHGQQTRLNSVLSRCGFRQRGQRLDVLVKAEIDELQRTQ